MNKTPLITIGIVAYNRAWIIDKMLASIQSQTYPHSSLYVLFVDGESKDGTAQHAQTMLKQSDFEGYQVIVKKCNIPEGRNICLSQMRGELLLFWDSDVIMPQDAVSRLVDSLQREGADLMSAVVRQITVASTDEIAEKIREITAPTDQPQKPTETIKAAMMGQSLLTQKLAKAVSFDEQLTIQEDTDFCLRAREQGFRLMLDPNITVLDVNMFNVAYSDICIDMSFGDALKGIRKKSKVQVYAYPFQRGWRRNFFWQYKRYVFYLLYLPALALTLYGLIAQNLIAALIFPAYALFYLALQIRRRGAGRGFRAFALSLLVGIPNALWVAVYWVKYKISKPK
ncbi:MAG: glycosyltransferase [Candidatus Bathyarchaeota archaeon]|nr:glycosyltransferase [Candidatus Bathyarchaeota archaeon]